jgi:hypothetical protein
MVSKHGPVTGSFTVKNAVDTPAKDGWTPEKGKGGIYFRPLIADN